MVELELLADLYMQADHYLPALETIDRLLSLPAARTLSRARRVSFETKSVECRIARGEFQAALAQTRELLRDEEGLGVPSLRARLHLHTAQCLIGLGRVHESRREADRALEIAEPSDLSLTAIALRHLGAAAYREGDLAEARDLNEQALALFRRLGDEDRAATIRNNLGLIAKNLCQWRTAIAHFEAALEVYRRTGHYQFTAAALLNLGIVHQKRGDWPGAEQCYRECEKVLVSIDDQLHLASVAIGQGNVARLQRRFAESETSLFSALERARRYDAKREEVLALEFLGELDFYRGRPESALARYNEALTLASHTAPEGDLVVELERRRAEALSSLGRFDEAEAACDRARRLARFTDDRFEHAITHRVAGDIALARGRKPEAIERWETAVSLLESCGERYELGKTHLSLGRSLEDVRRARVHVFQACALFADLGAHAWQEQAELELQHLMGAYAAPQPARTDSVLGRRHRAPSLVACSSAMRQVEALARRAASTELSVLVTGETGTGKELIARTIHTQSPRASRPFLAVNCGALRADLALSQLFGHRKGAFTGAHAEGVGLVEAAHGGTLFLDEVGELPLDVQVTLLRFLESGEYLRLGETQVRRADVRVIAATNRVLRGAEGEKSFRRDLLYRLNEIEIRLPSLRERQEDIVPLARHFLAFYGGLEGPRLSLGAEAVLRSYGWPGNVRELENVMKRVAALHSGAEEVGPDSILPFLNDAAPGARLSAEDAVHADRPRCSASAARRCMRA